MAEDKPEHLPPYAAETEPQGTGGVTDGGNDHSIDADDPHGGMDPAMLDLLVCPLTKTQLHYDQANNELVSEAARLAFPVRGGVPILLPSEARQIGDDGTADGAP